MSRSSELTYQRNDLEADRSKAAARGESTSDYDNAISDFNHQLWEEEKKRQIEMGNDY